MENGVRCGGRTLRSAAHVCSLVVYGVSARLVVYRYTDVREQYTCSRPRERERERERDQWEGRVARDGNRGGGYDASERERGVSDGGGSVRRILTRCDWPVIRPSRCVLFRNDARSYPC